MKNLDKVIDKIVGNLETVSYVTEDDVRILANLVAINMQIKEYNMT